MFKTKSPFKHPLDNPRKAHYKTRPTGSDDPLREELSEMLSSGESGEVMSAIMDVMAKKERVDELKAKLRPMRVRKLANALSMCPILQEKGLDDILRIMSIPAREVNFLVQQGQCHGMAEDEVREALDLSKAADVLVESDDESDMKMVELAEMSNFLGAGSDFDE